VTAAGLVIFMICAFLFRAVTVGELRHAMRRDRGIPGVPVEDGPQGGEG
jgi:hypothetical protein